jgi:phosphate:Na+ symporter
MTLSMIGSLLGGIGLFLLGMLLMTDGLKLAAGKTLRNILESSTNTPMRGLLSGALITSLVQSSGAVTVAIIGFVNAGLMSLSQAVTVIYGSNIGTTMTSWLVALVGFNINIKAFALPAIGIGMMQRLIKGPGRQGAMGEALAGFGVFFLGIDVLKSGFEGIGAGIQLANLGGGGFVSLFIFLGIGFLLTFLMQSSSAALAIVLTATAGGVIPLNDAAVMVIGANVGSTSTAALAVLGATSNAKRVAASHVIFNLITGLVALLILPLLLRFLASLQHIVGQNAGPVTILAMFHTTFNILGVMLLWPMTKKMVHFLKKRFKTAEEDEARPRYLDKNVVSTPVLAMHALAKELERLGIIGRRMAKGALSSEASPSPQLGKDKIILDKLETKVGEFVNLMQRSHLPAELDDLLPNGLRVAGYYAAIAELAIMTADKQAELQPLQDEKTAEDMAHFKGSVVKLLESVDVAVEGYNVDSGMEQMHLLIDEYHDLKAQLLREGTQGFISVRQMLLLQEFISYIRRIAEQAEKGARYLAGLTEFTRETEEEEEVEQAA